MRKSFVSLASVAMLLLLALPLLGVSQAARQTAGGAAARDTGAPQQAKSSSDVYIVQLKDAPLASYTGGVANIPATSPKATGGRKLDSESQSAKAYASYLAGERAKVLDALERALGRKVGVVYTYDTALNGMAVRLSAQEVAALAQVPGVVRVERDALKQPQTDVGPIFIGAQTNAARNSALSTATINGAQEVPPVTTSATGTGQFVYKASSKTLSFQIKLAGITPTLAHFHRGAAGVAGPVAYDIMPNMVAPGVYIGSVTLDAADETLLYGKGLYVNFHTAANPGGEIRGQVLPDWGEGMLVGILDSGINFAHTSFAAVGPIDGYVHTNPFGAGKYKGVCDPANKTIFQLNFKCNDKLVGAWSYTSPADASPLGEPSPADEDEHGSHTASTTVGNVVSSTLKLADGTSVNTGVVSGVAPHANLIAYDVCDADGCANSASVAAINQAVKDGVDVVNFSIGGGSDSPWDALDAIAFLNATNAGVLIASSAGNSGPGASTIGSPNNAPWVLSVAASTHNRRFANKLVGLTGGTGVAPGDLTGEGFTLGLAAPLPIVYANNYQDTKGQPNKLCAPFKAGTSLAGLIVVCDRGTYGRVEKSDNVKAAGGAGYVLVNDAPSAATLNSDVFAVPGVHLSYADGVKLKAWLASGTGQTARITGGSTPDYTGQGDAMASFSSRGPDATATDILKPDISAPGLNILAASVNSDPNADEFNILSGTSMSGPHSAGAATLVASLHPDWTPSEISSALMSTAVQQMVREDGVTPTTPFDRGSGRVDVGQAAQAGLVLNETGANYTKANPAINGQPRNLNRASMQDSRCIFTCTWTRTVRNTLGVTATWAVAATGDVSTTVTAAPASFTIKPGGTQTLTVTADVSKLALDTYGFGAVTLTAGQSLAPAAHLPVAVQAVASNLKDYKLITTDKAKSTVAITNVLALPISDLSLKTAGMVRGTATTTALSQDSNTDNAVTAVLTDGTYLQQQVVPTNTARFVTEIVTTTASDLDVYVYLDGSEGQPKDGKPQADELACQSATGAALEYCNIDNPAAGTYIILVNNFDGATAPLKDSIKLSTAVVPAVSAANFTVTGPKTQPAKTPFDLTLAWNFTYFDRSDRWYGAVDVGTSAQTAGNLGRVNVDLLSTTKGTVLYAPLAARAP